MADNPKDEREPSVVANIQLPAETVRRWKEIVTNSVKAGRDISVLVQQYAEQSFNAKLVTLDSQGARRRMLARARSSVDKEFVRADAHLKAEPATKPIYLAKFYTAQRIELPALGAASNATNDPKAKGELHHAVIALPDPLLKRPELEKHVATLTQQLTQIDRELPHIDSILNRGLKNQQAVVQELAAVSKELYRLAQEVAASLPAPTTEDKAGAKKKKNAGKIAPKATPAGPSVAPPADALLSPGLGSLSPDKVAKTVPINPLPLGLRKLRQDLSKPAGAIFEGTRSALRPVGFALRTATRQVSTTLGTIVGKTVTAVGATLAQLIQTIKDAWPWRGPPPG